VTPANVTIKKYDPKAAAAVKKKVEDDQYLISPITGEKIPASKAAEHMKVGLLDPRWVEERDKHISAKASEEVVFAPGQSIESSLKSLAERRTDIFGVGEEAAQETMIGLKMGDEEFKPTGDKVTWDGHSSSAESAARAARANISLNDQIAQIHKQKGLIGGEQDSVGVQQTKTVVVPTPAPPPMQVPMPVSQPMPTAVVVGIPVRPSMVAVQSLPLQVQPAPVFVTPPQMYLSGGGAPQVLPPMAAPMPVYDDDEPLAKRSKTEEALMSEGEFMARHQSPVHFKVLVPVLSDKPEWKCEGQMLDMSLALTDTVASIKSKISDEIGMPPGKQKLQLETMFLKDGNSLAYYNVMPGMAVSLQIKERGGRKK